MKFVYQVIGFILAGFLLFGVVAWRDREAEKRIRNEMQIAKRDTVIVELTDTLKVRDVRYVQGKTVFRDVAANPLSGRTDVINACNQVILSCDAVRATNDTLRDSLTKQIDALRKLKEKKPPRLSAYALAGYDWMNAAPLAQVGGDARILGPLSVTGYIEGSRATGAEKINARGVVGLKFTFR